MTNETSFREKGRAVFLAALMVLSVVAMSAAFVGGAAAQDQDYDHNFDGLDDVEGDVWIGQSAHVEGDFQERVRIYEGLPSDGTDSDRQVASLVPDSDNNVNFEFTEDDIDDLDEGDYFLYDTDTEETSQVLRTNEHEIETEFTAGVANQNVASLEYEDVSDTPRDGEEVSVYVSGEYDNETIDEDTLAEIFDGDAIEDEDMVLVSGVATEDTIDADFEGQDVGDYEFTISVADTTAEDTAEISVTDTDATAEFDAGTYEQNVGDVAEFTVEHESTDELWINITDEDEFYVAQLHVTDAGDTDNVTIQFNSFEAGHGEDTVVTALDDEGDELDVEVTETLGGDENTWDDDDGIRLLPGDYELEVIVQEDADEVDAAVLLLDDRSTGDMSTSVLPNVGVDDVDLETLENSTDRDYVAEGDLLVTEVEASGIYGYAFDDGNWDDGQGLEFNFNDTAEPRYGSADSFTLDDVDEDNYNIVADEDEDTFYVVVDVSEIGGDDGDASAAAVSATIDADETWSAEFLVTEDNPYVGEDEDEVADAEFDVEERSVELVGDFDEDDRFEVGNGEATEVTAETNVAPGTDATHRLRATSEIYTADSEVDDDGMISATFDLSNHDVGDELRTVRVSEDGGAEHDVEGVFVEPDEGEAEKDIDVSVDHPSSITTEESASFDTTVTNNKGSDITADVVFEIAGEEVSEELDVEAGSSADVSFTVEGEELGAGDHDFSVSVEGGDASDEYSGTLTVEEPGDNGNGDDPNGNGDDPNGNGNGDDDGDDDDDGTPGFGVAVAVVALLAAAMLALRRQD